MYVRLSARVGQTTLFGGPHANYCTSQFERGTIAYMITATLTRPTSISPTNSCERKLYLVEKIDIGSVAPPRARTIYLEPIPRRSRKRRTATVAERKYAVVSDRPETASDVDSIQVFDSPGDGSAAPTVAEENHDTAATNPRNPVHSDMRSDVSADSAVSTSTSTAPSGNTERNYRRDSSSQLRGLARKPGIEDRTITATIELLKGGCLPGDTVSVKISVQHIKRIKSMHGVIVTLYRQGRIDSAPPISLLRSTASEEDARRSQKEEYYPKSKTGLAGLSLSSAGSCSVFRKDLSQSFSPLIIDPITLTANVTTTVRIPEDAFPTIKGVPGEMISFKYQLEVIVDLGGRLASQIQSGQSSTPRVGAVVPPTAQPMTGNPFEGGAASLAYWGGRPIETDRLRREKGVVSVAFEVVVGTDDSSRQRGKGVMRGSPSIYTQQNQEQSGPHEAPNAPQEEAERPSYDPSGYARAHDGYQVPGNDTAPYSSHNTPRPPDPPAPFYVPPPAVPIESQLSEKERIRQAEQRLLPSQPGAGPSSPAYPDGDNIYDAEDEPPQAGQSSHAPPLQPTSHPDDGASAPPDHHLPSAPTLDEIAVTDDGGAEDKQELERQRLLAEASAPPEFPDDYDTAAGPSNSAPAPSSQRAASAGSAAAAFEPSAPVLGDEEHYGPHHAYQELRASTHRVPSGPTEELPRYER